MVKTSFLSPSWSMANIGHRGIAIGSSLRSQFLIRTPGYCGQFRLSRRGKAHTLILSKL